MRDPLDLAGGGTAIYGMEHGNGRYRFTNKSKDKRPQRAFLASL